MYGLTTMPLHVRSAIRTSRTAGITEGIEAGQRIVVEGVQRLRAGIQVAASPYEPPVEAAD